MKAGSDGTMPLGRPLRVLFPITDLGKGGAERFLLDLCRAFQRRNDVEFLIAPLYDNNRYPELSAGLPIAQLEYETFSFTRPRKYAAWERVLLDFKPDVIHTHRFLAEFLSSQHVREGTAYVCHGHDNMVQFEAGAASTLFDRTRLMHWIEKRYLVARKYNRIRTAFVANSNHTLAYYKKVLPARMRRDVRLIHYGFDYQRFRASAPRGLRRDKPLRLVNAGSFFDKKNQQLVVRVGEVLAQRAVNFQIDLLGDGPNRQGLEAKVCALGLQDKIHFRGNVDRVEDWLSRADVCLHTARYEPFGLVLLEAMAAGLPCIIRNGLGDRELIVEGQNGHLLNDEEPTEYANLVQALAADPHRYARMSAYAIDFAKKFDIDGAAEEFLHFYQRWRAENSRPANEHS